MKKKLLTLLAAISIFGVACANENQEPTETEEEQEISDLVEEQEEQEEEQEEKQEEQEESEEPKEEESDSTEAEDLGELAEIDEYEILTDKIDLSKFTPDVKEDNDYKRIILFKNEQGKESYKSIYIKKDNRLKIIEFNNGQIFNERI